MLRRFRLWLARLLQGTADGELARERQGRLAAERGLQQLRLDLQQAQQRVAHLQADLDRLRRGQGDALSERLHIQLEELLTPLATPLAQLLTQQHLIEDQGKQLSARDLLATSRRIWQALTPAGLEALENIGQVVSFDPDRHQPLSQATVLSRGEPVRVRIPGIALKGRVLKAAAVEPGHPGAGQT